MPGHLLILAWDFILHKVSSSTIHNVSKISVDVHINATGSLIEKMELSMLSSPKLWNGLFVANR